MHSGAYNFIRRSLGAIPSRVVNGAVLSHPCRVVEIGSRNVNGGVRELFDGAVFIGVDIARGWGVDVVADGATYQPDELVDTVVCCEVLEHTQFGMEICGNARRMLTAGGVFLVTCATEPRAPHSAVDGGPLHGGEFYSNVDPEDLRDWLGGFDDVQIEVDRMAGDLRAIASVRS